MSHLPWHTVTCGAFVLLVLVCICGIVWEECDKRKYQRGWKR